MLIHVVQKGETLWSISRSYGVSLDRIIAANQPPDPSRLAVGQALVIPVPDNIHVVAAGESLWLIAQRYGVTVQALAQENQLSAASVIYPGQVLRIPKPTKEVNAYLTQMGAAGVQIMNNLAQYFTYASPFSYHVLPDGSLVSLNEGGALEAARAKRAAPMLCVTNFSGSMFSSELAHSILSSADAQNRLITNLTNTMRAKGYRALNIDFEYLYPEDRELYNRFLGRVVNSMHNEGFLVSTALAPKLTAGQKGLLYEAHDYPVHGQLDDFVILMTYEWGWIGGPPMAVAPIDQVRHVLDYAVTAIPRNKIMMGAPLYGYDWRLPYKAGTLAQNISPQTALSRAVQYGAQIQYDQVSQSPFYRYWDAQGVQHIVWFEDARSMQAKYNLIKEYGLRGVSYWELSTPFPQNWPVLVSNFNIRKLL